MSMKKLLCVTLVLVMLIGILPVGLIASAAEEIVLNKDSAEYSEVQGLFFEDPFIMDEGKAPTRYSFTKDAKLTYKLDVPAAGNYEVYYYNAAAKTNRAQQEVVVKSDNGESKIILYLKENSQWKNLGVYKLTPGNAEFSISNMGKGGCIRSGAIKLVPTTADVAVGRSESNPNVINYGDLTGIVISVGDEGYAECGTGRYWDTLVLPDCRGNLSRWSVETDAGMIYTPNITEAGDYHVLYNVLGHESNGTEAITVKHKDGEFKVDLDTAAHDGWVYLGKFPFAEGEVNYLRADFKSKFVRSGGARFVNANDETFRADVYSTPDKPRTGTGAVIPGATMTPPAPKKVYEPIANETNPGEYIMAPGMDGFSEITTGGNDYLYRDCYSTALLACNGRKSREVQLEGPFTFRYTPNLKTAGEYEVFLYALKSANSSPNQKVLVKHKGGETTLVYDATKESGWISLGKYSFDAGTEGYVSVPKASGGFLRAGGACFKGKENTTFNPGSVPTITSGETTTAQPSTPAPATTPVPSATSAPSNVEVELPSGTVEGAEPDAAGEYIIPPTGKGYKEVGPTYAFKGGSSLLDCVGKPSKYIDKFPADGPIDGSYAMFTPNIKTAGEYEVLFFVVGHEYNNAAQRILVKHADGESTVTVNCKQESGWVSLGKYKFNAGTEGCVIAPYDKTIVRLGGVKFTQNGAGASQGTTPAPTPTSAPTTKPTTAPTTTTPPAASGGATANADGEYIIASDTAGYSEVGVPENFFGQSSLKDALGKPSNYLTGGNKSDYMLFTPDLKEAGEYEVLYYVLPHATNSASQRIVITHEGGTEEKTVDCIIENGWVSLGKYNFKAGTAGNVALYASSSGMTRSGGIKFVKVK